MTDTNLSMVRGDTKIFDVAVTDESGAAVAITGATIRFTAKNQRTDSDGDAIIALSTTTSGVSITDGAGGILRVTIPPSATNAFTSKKWLEYDVQIVESGGRTSTVVSGRLEVSLDATVTNP